MTHRFKPIIASNGATDGGSDHDRVARARRERMRSVGEIILHSLGMATRQQNKRDGPTRKLRIEARIETSVANAGGFQRPCDSLATPEGN
jgi:hypothetical protein